MDELQQYIDLPVGSTTSFASGRILRVPGGLIYSEIFQSSVPVVDTYGSVRYNESFQMCFIPLPVTRNAGN